MRKLLAFFLCFLVSTLFFTLLPPPAAKASGWEWRQDDWSGGPGQAAWVDDARYSFSAQIDTMNVPGTLRISHIFNPATVVKSPSNPVLATGAAGTWDNSGLIGRPQPRKGGGYEILYSGLNLTSGFGVGYASSPDGVNWQKNAGNPLLKASGAAWDALGVAVGPMIKEGSNYRLWFPGYAATGINYGLATSSDLITWSRNPNSVFAPGSTGAWDEQLGDLRIIKDGPLYKMWYNGITGGTTTQVGYATSQDGITWTRHAANPVLPVGAPGTLDDTGISSCCLLKRPWAGDYLMLYTAQGSTTGLSICAATSPDGITWTKNPGNPVIPLGGAGTWNQNAVRSQSLTFDGSIYKLILTGTDGGNLISSGESFSTSGIGWSPPAQILPVGAPGSFDSNVAWIESSYLEGNNLRAFYFGGSLAGAPNGIATATCTPIYWPNGGLESSVFDTGSTAQWGNVTWKETKPAGTNVQVWIRTGNVPVPDASWTAYTAVANGGAVPHPASRYIQYVVAMSGPGNTTPEVSNITVDFTALPTTWYFAEGYTGPGFDEWISVENPNPAAANLTVTYYTPGGVPVIRNHTAQPQSRMTIYVNNDLGSNLESSFKIASDQQVIVERPMYFRYTGTGGYSWEGGHDAMGSTTLSRHWYFAEGYTGQGVFEEWLTIQNPNPGWATIDVTYFVNGGAPINKQHLVAPTSRYTINVNSDAGPNLEVSSKISSDLPVLAERPLYFNYQGSMDGGHIVMGSPYLAQDWYLAEGATFPPFTEYVTIQNPNPAPANLIVTYYVPGGVPILRNHTVAAQSRYTINAGADSGQASDLSTYVHSDQQVLVERPMYFNMLGGGLAGGHCAMGVNSPSPTWYFAEGYTGPGFDEWLTIENPGPAQANVQVTYYVSGGAPIIRNHTVAAQTRYTIDVNADAGDNLEISTCVSSNQPVICERPMYFFYQGHHAYNWPGGHDSQGFAP